MKKEYDTSVKEAIERVMSVFSEYIKTTPYFDIVWSGKVGYIYISIDSCRGTVGDMDCLVIDSPEELLDKLLYEMAVDIMEEVEKLNGGSILIWSSCPLIKIDYSAFLQGRKTNLIRLLFQLEK